MKVLKSVRFLAILVAICSPAAFAAEEITVLLQNEMKRAKENIQLELETARKKLDTLRQARDRAEANTRKLAEAEQVGVELLKSYVVLLNTRYVNAKGEYQPGYELSTKDQEYINRLFGKYLRAHPLQGKVSAGEAVRTINWGVSRLGELIRMHSAPTPLNNAELEIIASQTKELEAAILKNSEVAKKLGVYSTTRNFEETPEEGEVKRKPASESSDG